MIATIGLPGLPTFHFKRFALRGKALSLAVEAWRAEWLARVGETQETLGAVRQGVILSEENAAKQRYPSGAFIYR